MCVSHQAQRFSQAGVSGQSRLPGYSYGTLCNDPLRRVVVRNPPHVHLSHRCTYDPYRAEAQTSSGSCS